MAEDQSVLRKRNVGRASESNEASEGEPIVGEASRLIRCIRDVSPNLPIFSSGEYDLPAINLFSADADDAWGRLLALAATIGLWAAIIAAVRAVL